MNKKILTLTIEDADKDELVLAVEQMLKELKEGFSSGKDFIVFQFFNPLFYG